MNENHMSSLKRLKEISKMIEATLHQNNRLKNILASELYFRKKCEASLELIDNTTNEQECYRKVSKIFIKKPRDSLKKELKEEIGEYEKHTPHLVELRKKLVDKLSNLKEQFVQTHECIEKETNRNS
ncbi:conserved Plasmodium protein, unknown function [Plasmodium gallinaceum]|uniref:Mediator of RNA polymerase II transcription subunit 11 n=1 Tax=Plasmodium gallinaceum TaxID=5849 RepID=A0A1J1GZ22_PLAGA|nr:conserved Plasmodium protein, unknown function [Plasmodium gallinaceum]CRG97835.1 conserved Plasmodium protein, unknown function [Plasmodium gallinaceum]